MDTITTDSGKKLKIEEAWVITNPELMTYAGGTYAKTKGYTKVKRVWVLVEVEDPDVDITNPQWERIEY